MKKIKFDINQVKAIDLDGMEIPVSVSKTVGNVIYMKATTLEWDNIARDIHSGKPVELTESELQIMQGLLLSPEIPIYLMIKKPLKNYFETLLKAKK